MNLAIRHKLQVATETRSLTMYFEDMDTSWVTQHKAFIWSIAGKQNTNNVFDRNLRGPVKYLLT